MKNIPSAQARTHAHTHKLPHTHICGKPTCLPGKPWRPRGLDSLGKHTLFLSQCGQCVTSAWNQLAEEEEEERGSLGQMILELFHCKHSPEAYPPPRLFSDVPLEAQTEAAQSSRRRGVKDSPQACLCCLPFISEPASSCGSGRHSK